MYYLDGTSLLLYPVHATFLVRVDHIAVGYNHTLALADEGVVFSWVYPDRVSCNRGRYSGCYSECNGRYSSGDVIVTMTSADDTASML